MADGSQMDEQVQHRFVRDGYAILPAGTMPVGLAEAAQAQHSTALLMAALVVQVAPPAWAAIEQLPEIHRTVPSKAYGKHGLKPTVQRTFKFKHTVQIPHHRVHNEAVHQKLSGEDVAVASDESPTTLELASCGRPPPEVDVRLVQPETRVTCGPNQVGELWIRSASVAKGYWRQPQQTFAAFGVTTAEEEAGGWLRTGDMGFVRGGEIFVCARWKDQVVVGGYVAPLALPVNPQASFQPTDNHSRPSPFIAMPHFTLTLMPSSPWAAQNLIVMLQEQNKA